MCATHAQCSSSQSCRETDLELQLPLLPKPPSARQALLLRECIVEGLLDRVAVSCPDLGNRAYICADLGRERPVFIHTSSNAFRHRPHPSVLVFNEIISTHKHFMRDCVTVDPLQLAKRAAAGGCPLLQLGEFLPVPAPRYLSEQDKVLAFASPLYAPLAYSLPTVEVDVPSESNFRYKVFAKALLEGMVVRGLPCQDKLLARPTLLLHAPTNPRVSAVVSPLWQFRVGSRSQLLAKWRPVILTKGLTQGTSTASAQDGAESKRQRKEDPSWKQRAWIALNHHQIPYEYVEALTLKLEPGQTLKDAKGYEKHPLLLKHHPSGLVPTIVRADESQPAVYESLTCIEFADDLAEKSKRAGPRPLLPEDPVLRARARIWASWADKNISSNFYAILVPTDVERRREGHAKLVAALQKLQDNLRGPFFFGDDLSIVDIAALPWCYRIFTCGIIGRYRDASFSFDLTGLAPLQAWLDACLALPAVQQTLPDPERLVDTYKRYADGTAESKVGAAVRAGKSAHEHE
ncbi:DHX37 [Symbiodinium natans]|uniref:DHX37 protein n=1 Tax=Symbiodinium natans TaxID=878477 RepID=A0A812PNG9_9DINO|nr:DHX37 [Symbiodinium natans]